MLASTLHLPCYRENFADLQIATHRNGGFFPSSGLPPHNTNDKLQIREFYSERLLGPAKARRDDSSLI